jgi:hypothetical protein
LSSQFFRDELFAFLEGSVQQLQHLAADAFVVRLKAFMQLLMRPLSETGDTSFLIVQFVLHSQQKLLALRLRHLKIANIGLRFCLSRLIEVMCNATLLRSDIRVYVCWRVVILPRLSQDWSIGSTLNALIFFKQSIEVQFFFHTYFVNLISIIRRYYNSYFRLHTNG